MIIRDHNVGSWSLTRGRSRHASRVTSARIRRAARDIDDDEMIEIVGPGDDRPGGGGEWVP